MGMDNTAGKELLKKELETLEEKGALETFEDDARIMGYEDIAILARAKIDSLYGEAQKITTTPDVQKDQISNLGGSLDTAAKLAEGVDGKVEEVKVEAEKEITAATAQAAPVIPAPEDPQEPITETSVVSEEISQTIKPGSGFNESTSYDLEKDTKITDPELQKQENLKNPELNEAKDFLKEELNIASEINKERGFTLAPRVRKYKAYSEAHTGTADYSDNSKDASAYDLLERSKKYIELKYGNDPKIVDEKLEKLLTNLEYTDLQDNPYYQKMFASLTLDQFKEQQQDVLNKVRFFDAVEEQKNKSTFRETALNVKKIQEFNKLAEDPQIVEKVKSGDLFFESNQITPLIVEKLIASGSITPSDVAESLKRYAEEQLKKSKDAGYRSSRSDSESIQDTIKSQLIHNFGDQLPVNLVKQIVEAGNFQSIVYEKIENDISKYNTGKLYKHIGYQSNLKKASEFITDASQKQKFKEKFGKEPDELYLSELKQDLEDAFMYSDPKEDPDIKGTFFANRSFSHKMDGYFDELFKNQIAPREKIMEALKKSVDALKFAEDRQSNSDQPDRQSKIYEILKLKKEGYITAEETEKLLTP